MKFDYSNIFSSGFINLVHISYEFIANYHPLDVQTLLIVFQKLIENSATVIVIEHDLDVIENADYIIDMGPEGGDRGGGIIFAGTPDEILNCKKK